MATHLDLEEQEQLDHLKALWKRYGSLLTWLTIVVLAGFAAWNGWNWYQRDQAGKSGAMLDQLEKAVQAGDVDQAARVFADLKERYPLTASAEQGGLMAAKLQVDKGKPDAALETLRWVGANARETEYRTIAKLRAAGLLLDQKKFDDALKLLDATNPPEFSALVGDRRGDVLNAQGNKEAAKAAYADAWRKMDSKVDYRRLIDAKLTALGEAPREVGKPAENAK